MSPRETCGRGGTLRAVATPGGGAALFGLEKGWHPWALC